MDEHGQMLEGEMNMNTLPYSAVSKAMLEKYNAVCFGGNYVVREAKKVKKARRMTAIHEVFNIIKRH